MASSFPPRSNRIATRPGLEFERELWLAGHRCIAGVDEAGRGPLAGPVVAAAVVLPPDFAPAEWPLLNDSKQIKATVRAELFERLVATVAWGVASVEAETIDRINIRQASWLAMQNAVADLVARGSNTAQSTLMPDYVLIDGLGYGPGPWPYQAIVKGDTKSLSIAAASIIAKETRDQIMREWDSVFPDYGFAQHKGYGSSQHLRALHQHGVCVLHRRSFAPIREVCAVKHID